MLAVYPVLNVPAVAAIVGTRIYQDIARPDAVAPYVVWSRLAVVPENNLSNPPPGDRESISVDVFAKTEAQRDALTVAVRNALEARGHVLTIQSLGQDVDTQNWRMTLDADIHSTR